MMNINMFVMFHSKNIKFIILGTDWNNFHPISLVYVISPPAITAKKTWHEKILYFSSNFYYEKETEGLSSS